MVAVNDYLVENGADYVIYFMPVALENMTLEYVLDVINGDNPPDIITSVGCNDVTDNSSQKMVFNGIYEDLDKYSNTDAYQKLTKAYPSGLYNLSPVSYTHLDVYKRQMLESMITNIRPTRAEISDVANAVYDGTSAIMLSGETAAGKYPVKAVEVMAKIAERTEQSIHYDKRFRNFDFQIRNEIDAISHATCGMAIDIKAKGIAVCTLSGMTARMISRFRSPVDIVGLTTNEKTWRKLALSWGVTPIMVEEFDSTEVLFYTAKKTAKEVLGLEKDDRIVITGGYTNGTSGNTNLIKVERI